MALAIRLARGGAKKRPYYRIVVTDARNARDGKFLEKLGTYNPLLNKENPDRIKLDTERAAHWLSVGAQPSDRVARFLDAAGVRTRAARSNPVKGVPGANAKERAEVRATKAAEAVDAAEAARVAAAEAAAAAAEASAAAAAEVAATPEPTAEEIAETGTDGDREPDAAFEAVAADDAAAADDAVAAEEATEVAAVDATAADDAATGEEPVEAQG